MKTSRSRPSRSWLVFAASCGFLAGMVVMAALFAIFPEETRPAQAVEVRPTRAEEPAPVTPSPVPQAVAIPSIGADPIADLRRRHLDLPVKGAEQDDVKDMFNELRGGTRRHEAIDILSPRNTPVVAVEDGVIARLFFSEAGGTTVYQFDPSTTYVYYYAHLERYADRLKEGDKVKRGELLGYVGTTGNAPKDTPHLHFAIFKMTEKKQWWQGTAIDPFQVLR